MKKYYLNFLRWITQGRIENEILKKSFNHRIEDGKFKFNVKVKINSNDWKWRYGSTRKTSKQ